MTSGKEGHRLGKASQYFDTTWSQRRGQIIDRELPWIVDEVLASDEIAAGIAHAGLDRATLRQQILDARQEILAPADAQLDNAIETAIESSSASTVITETAPRRLAGIGSMLVSGGLIALPTLALVYWWEVFASWGIALGIGVGVILALVGVAVFLDALEEFRGVRMTSSPEAELEYWRLVCKEEGVLPFVRRLIDKDLEPIARTLLDVTVDDAPGLRGTNEASYVVRTSSVTNFLEKVAQLPTGAIALAGPRGVGKTSLIEHFAGGTHSAYRPLKVMVSAPVQYEPTDFVLHLFARVCQAVLRERQATMAHRVQSPKLLVWRAVSVMALALSTGALFFLLGHFPRAAVVATTIIIVVLLVVWLVTQLRREAASTAGVARRHLETIHYLRTHTSGWSGKVPLPLRAEAGWNRQVQRERRAQTYPELVDALRGFLAACARPEGHTPAMIIAIDELDKIESADDAQKFVNEIKGIFGAPGTQFLVSVSEDALASFERRGLPVRDAFDSAFHEIVRIDYLTLTDTAELLSSRVLRLPEPFKWLVHCMSGGLPRDVVRAARAMVALGDKPAPSLDDVCAALVADDLRRKSHAFQLACRDIGDSPEVTKFIRSLRRLPGDAETLLGLVPVLRQDGDLATLSRQAAAYVYYSATLLQVFTRDRVDSHDSDTFDLLARARQSLAVHPRLAWLQIDEFRESWGLGTVPVD